MTSLYTADIESVLEAADRLGGFTVIHLTAQHDNGTPFFHVVRTRTTIGAAVRTCPLSHNVNAVFYDNPRTDPNLPARSEQGHGLLDIAHLADEAQLDDLAASANGIHLTLVCDAGITPQRRRQATQDHLSKKKTPTPPGGH
tara:strand:+ start:1972 stop:2397 length:426 start_codon:yes stop_codon:yes gene_type:complete